MNRGISRWRWVMLLAGVVAVAAVVRLLPVGRWLELCLDSIDDLGLWAPLIYLLLYTVSTVFLVPGSILTVGAGAVFGIIEGSVYALAGATAGATCAFLIGRHLARDRLTARMNGRPRFRAVDDAVAREGWKIVFLMRLSPFFPFTLLNYAFGLTRVELLHYIAASAIGMIPSTVMYVYLGSIATLAAADRAETTFQWIFYGAGFVSTVLVTVLVTRVARKALSRQLQTGE